MRRLFTILISALICLQGQAQGKLDFNAQGQFKILQFTDLHYIPGKAESEATIQCLRTVIPAENPDLIVFTGDIVTAKNTPESYRTIFNLVSEYGVPFAVAFGNHDDEYGTSRADLFKVLQEYPLNRTISTEGISGVGNCVLTIGKDASYALYLIDSHAYYFDKKVSKYDCIHLDQINWYYNQSKALEALYGHKVPALAFFHIPLPEYTAAAMDEKTKLIGHRYEAACPCTVNSGMFSAMLERGDVFATFTGHDHDNDYVAFYKGIALCYGRFTGSKNTYTHLSPNGGRVILLQQSSPEVTTWVRLSDSTTENTIRIR